LASRRSSRPPAPVPFRVRGGLLLVSPVSSCGVAASRRWLSPGTGAVGSDRVRGSHGAYPAKVSVLVGSRTASLRPATLLPFVPVAAAPSSRFRLWRPVAAVPSALRPLVFDIDSVPVRSTRAPPGHHALASTMSRVRGRRSVHSVRVGSRCFFRVRLRSSEIALRPCLRLARRSLARSSRSWMHRRVSCLRHRPRSGSGPKTSSVRSLESRMWAAPVARESRRSRSPGFPSPFTRGRAPGAPTVSVA
jgi:hypothetical protein